VARSAKYQAWPPVQSSSLPGRDTVSRSADSPVSQLRFCWSAVVGPRTHGGNSEPGGYGRVGCPVRADSVNTVFVIALDIHKWAQPSHQFTGNQQRIFNKLNPNVNAAALPPPLVEPADREQDSENNRLWPRWAARNEDVHRQDLAHTARAGIAV
jgi:hypothetical protein